MPTIGRNGGRVPVLSSYFFHHPPRQLLIALSINLRDVGHAVPEDDLGGLQAVLLADHRGGRVPQLVGREPVDTGRVARPLDGLSVRARIVTLTRLALRVIPAIGARAISLLRIGLPVRGTACENFIVGVLRTEQVRVRIAPQERPNDPL